VADKKKDDKFDFVGDPSDSGAAGRGGEAALAAGVETAKAAESTNIAPDKIPPKPDGIKVKSIEVAGVHIDSEGHSWTIPEKDETDVRYKSIFTIPNPDPLMGYQFIRKEELSEMMGEQWVPVTRKEIGVAEFKSEAGSEYGGPLDGYHVVGTQICVKKPKILIERQYAAQKRVCDAAVAATEPPPPGRDNKEQEARNGAQYPRGQRRYALDRKVEKVTPKNAASEQVTATE
jgi:hypothetical protein